MDQGGRPAAPPRRSMRSDRGPTRQELPALFARFSGSPAPGEQLDLRAPPLEDTFPVEEEGR